MRVVRSLDEVSWRRFVDEQPDGSIFHTPEMFEVFSRAKGFWPTLFAVVDEDNDPLALFLPVKISLVGGPFRYFTTRATAFAPALVVPGSIGAKALSLLLEVYNRKIGKDVLYTKLRNVSDTVEVQPVLQEHGFDYEDHLNYLVDLTRPVDEIFASISKSGRNAVRRSQRRGVVPKELRSRSQMPAYYDLLLQSHLRANFPLADISLFEAICCRVAGNAIQRHHLQLV
jgi:serine/alanine adding enzyme